ncbi:hypothetical protein RFI_23423 [Reticulomyxa filosa]|uniref:Uncharacterized protein n=1 Tax=Reticulomyxa filosa TaxID=46433 RepID=X6MLK8_RETFI|nr:hypothetical protein RFI_23423 [Reticulomyxa filosa]|eukprot:ETO13945.1 hypothetical protein RFI_23423 [Reticulomyxa filosa]
MRPQNSLVTRLSLQAMDLEDFYTSNTSDRFMIMTAESNRDKPLMEIVFETNPLDKVADSKLQVSIQDYIVDLHIPLFLRLGEFFGQEKQVDLHAFERAAMLQLEAMKKLSHSNYQTKKVFIYNNNNNNKK